MKPWIMLAISIVLEVVATTALKSSQGLTRLGPSLLSVLGYCLAFYLVAKVMNHLPTGVVYAVWSGLGIVLVSLAAWFWQGQTLDAPALAGIALIVAGVLVIQLFSRAPTAS